MRERLMKKYSFLESRSESYYYTFCSYKSSHVDFEEVLCAEPLSDRVPRSVRKLKKDGLSIQLSSNL